MSIKVGINGFGRIGRNVLKGILQEYNGRIEVVAINDLTSIETCAHLFKFDSIYGVYPINVETADNMIRIGTHEIRLFSQRSPDQIPWGESGVDVVIESTGLFRDAAKAKGHLRDSVKKVIISAPAKGEDLTIVLGVNESMYVQEKHNIISCASCTTNCVAQIINIVHRKIGIQACTFSTVHAYSNDQSIIDQPHSDLRRARALAFNIIPTTTGAGVAVEKVIPELAGKINAMAYRVPVHCGSLVDCTFVLKEKTTKDYLNNMFLEAANGAGGKYLGYTNQPLVSCDFKADPRSAVVDGLCTEVLDGNIAKIVAWYDNEWSYSMRVADLIAYIYGIV